MDDRRHPSVRRCVAWMLGCLIAWVGLLLLWGLAPPCRRFEEMAACWWAGTMGGILRGLGWDIVAMGPRVAGPLWEFRIDPSCTATLELVLAFLLVMSAPVRTSVQLRALGTIFAVVIIVNAVRLGATFVVAGYKPNLAIWLEQGAWRVVNGIVSCCVVVRWVRRVWRGARYPDTSAQSSSAWPYALRPALFGSAVLLALVGAAGTTRAGEDGGPRLIEGRVVDASGSPVAGASIAYNWTLHPIGHFAPEDPCISREDGSWVLSIPAGSRAKGVMALDAAQKRAAIAVIDPRTAPSQHVLALMPMISLEFSTPPLDGTTLALSAGISVRVVGTDQPVLRSSAEGSARVPVPPGHYVMRWEGREIESLERTVDLRQAESRFDLGLLPLSASPLAMAYGRALPAVMCVAREGRRVLDDRAWRGRWIVLEFWSTTCGPCVRRGIPALVEFAREFSDCRDAYEVLLVHDATITDFQVLEAELNEVSTVAWGGELPSFSLLLDSEDVVLRGLGVKSLPSMIVVDPEGRVMPRAGLDDLALILLAKRPRVSALLAQLPRTLEQGLEPLRTWLKHAVVVGGRGGAYACVRAGELTVGPAEMSMVHDALRRLPAAGAEVLTFLTGLHGMRSGSLEIRRSATRLFADTAEPGWVMYAEALLQQEPEADGLRPELEQAIATMRRRAEQKAGR